MIDKNKVLTFYAAIVNAYRSEENREPIEKIELSKDVTEDFTSIVYALNVFFDKLIGQDIDIIDFTHVLNKLVVQNLIENKDGKEE